MDSKTWRLWVFIRKWIIKALRESLNNENPPEWEENLPSIADAISTSTFGPEWKKYMTLSEGGGTVDPYIKIGHEATTTRYNVCMKQQLHVIMYVIYMLMDQQWEEYLPVKIHNVEYIHIIG